MKIRITKCSVDTYWYKEKVGDVFTVFCEHENAYAVGFTSDGDYGFNCIVLKQDCEVIADENMSLNGLSLDEIAVELEAFKNFLISHIIDTNKTLLRQAKNSDPNSRLTEISYSVGQSNAYSEVLSALLTTKDKITKCINKINE